MNFTDRLKRLEEQQRQEDDQPGVLERISAYTEALEAHALTGAPLPPRLQAYEDAWKAVMGETS